MTDVNANVLVDVHPVTGVLNPNESIQHLSNDVQPPIEKISFSPHVILRLNLLHCHTRAREIKLSPQAVPWVQEY